MSTPDIAAATPLSWKEQPLPEYGATIKTTWMDTSTGSWKTRTATLVVRTISLADDGATLIVSDGMTEARLTAGRLTDRWHTVLAPVADQMTPTFDPAPPAEPQRPTAPAVDMTTLAGMQRRWLWLTDQADVVEAQLKALKAERARINDEIVEEVVLQGLDAPPALDGMTFSLAPVWFAEYKTDEDGNRYGAAQVVPVLRSLGMAAGIVSETYNGNSFKAMLRERREAGLEIPAELADLVELRSKSQVRATRSAAARRAGREAASSD
jgi:hypothetical protein